MKRFVPSRSAVTGLILSTIALFQCSNSFAQTTWYLDNDNDGWGDVSNTTMSMAQPMGYVRNSLDCDDGIVNGIKWDVVDSRGFSSGQVSYNSLAIDPSGVPYMAYKDLANGNKATVMMLNAGVWAPVGSAGLSTGSTDYISLAIDGSGTPYVAYKDGVATNKVTVQKYNGSNWVTVGTAGFSAGQATYVSLAIDPGGTPYVAYKDAANANLATVMMFDGANWVVVGGAGFSAGTADYISLKIDNSGVPYIAYRDGASAGAATVMMFNGANWVTVGTSGFSAGQATYLSLAINSSGAPYVSYRDAANANKSTVMMYNGANWVAVGAAGFSAVATYLSLDIDAEGTPFLGFSSSTKAVVMKYNGANWVTVGNNGASPGNADFTSLAIDKNNTGLPYITFRDKANSNTATVTVIAPDSIYPSVTIVSDAAANTICDGTSVMFTATPTNGGSAPTYQWKKNGVNVGTNSDTYTDAGLNNNDTISVYIVSNKPCFATSGVRSNPIRMIVNPIPSVNPVSDLVKCNNTSSGVINFTSNVTGTTYAWTNDNTSINLAANGTGKINSFTATNMGNAAEIANISVTPTANGCVGNPEDFTITVNPTPTVDAIANQVVCNNNMTDPVMFTGTVSGTIYAWTNNTTSIGLAAATSGDIAAFNAINSSNAPVTATIKVTPSANGCTGAFKNFTIKVNPTPTINPVADIVRCNGVSTGTISFSGAVTGTTYAWVNNNASIGLAASGNGNIASFSATNATNAPITGTINVTPTANSCPGSSEDFTITVNPTPTVDVIANQVICNNNLTDPVAFTGDVSGTAYAWTNTTTSIGLAATGSGDIAAFTANNSGTSPVTGTIRVTPSANGCTGSFKNFTIKVNPTPTVNAISSIVRCNGATVNLSGFGGTVSGTTYAWTNNNTAIGLAASGNGNIASFTATNTTNAPISGTINVTPTANGCPGSPQSFTITVNPTATVNALADVVVCNGVTTSAINVGGPVSGSTFAWTNNTSSIGLPSSGSGNIPSFTATNTSTTPIIATVIVTPTANSCKGTPDTLEITVNPTARINTIPNVVICNGDMTNTISFSGAVAGTTFSWTNNTPGIGLAASGNSNIAPFTATNTGNSVVTATITVTPSANGCAGTPRSFTIKVNPSPVVTPLSNIVRCNGTATGTITFASSVTGSTYAWTNDDTTIGLRASGSGNINSFTARNSGNTPVVANITVTPTASTCPGATESFTITVNPTPTVNAIADREVCNGTPSTLISFSGAVSGTNYNWTNSNTSIGLAANGSGNIFPFSAVNNGTSPINATITVTPSANGCTGPVETFRITVNPTPTVNTVSNIVKCNGAASGKITFTGSVNNTTYNWTNSNTSIGLAATGTGNIASFTTTNTGNAPATANIMVTPTVNGCAGSSGNFTITVNPTPTVNAIADQTVCNNGTTSTITFSGAVPGTAYNWTNNATSIGLGASGTGDIGAFTATNISNSPVTATIKVTPQANTCSGDMETFTITVNPTPGVNNIPNMMVCNSDATNAINFGGAVSGTTYSWTNNNTTVGLAASGTGNIASFTATNNGAIPTMATITVSPAANGCNGPSKSFTITVNPTPTVIATADQTLCNNAQTIAINFTGAVAGTAYTWKNDKSSIGLATSGTGNIPAFTAKNNTFAPVTATIVVTPKANGCTGNTDTFNITVNPTPDIAVIANQVKCNGATTDAVNFSGNVSGTTFTWTNSATTIGLGANGTGDINPFTAINTADTSITATITVSSSANSCAGSSSRSFKIKVNPTPIVNTLPDVVKCNLASTTVSLSSKVTGTTYTWTNSDTSIGLPETGSSKTITFIAKNKTTAPVIATIVVTPEANTCVGPTEDFNITVNPTPIIDTTWNQVLCNNALTDSIWFTGPVSGTTFAWTNTRPAVGLAASGNGDIRPFTAINTFTAPVTATITVKPTANGCPGIDSVFQIKINPTPGVLAISDKSFCNMDNIPVRAITGTVAGSTFTWTNDNTDIGLGAGGAGDIPAFTVTNTTFEPIKGTIIITPTANGCVGINDTFIIAANPIPALSSELTLPTLCAGLRIEYTPTTQTSNTSIRWERPSITGILPSTGRDSGRISEVLKNTTLDKVEVSYKYTLIANGCKNEQTVKLFVEPVPDIAKIKTKSFSEVCANTFFQNFSADTLAPSGMAFTWIGVNAAIHATGKDKKNCLVSFFEPGKAAVYLYAKVEGYNCESIDSVIVNVKETYAHSPRVVYHNNRFLCMDNTLDKYQWGYDRAGSLDSVTFLDGVNQDYYEPSPDFTNRYYFVITAKDGCSQKTYYNAPTAIKELKPLEATTAKVYPNPATETVTIEISNSQLPKTSTGIMDLSGRLLRQEQMINGKATFNIGDLPAGVYTVICHSDGTRIAVTKFIKN